MSSTSISRRSTTHSNDVWCIWISHPWVTAQSVQKTCAAGQVICSGKLMASALLLFLKKRENTMQQCCWRTAILFFTHWFGVSHSKLMGVSWDTWYPWAEGVSKGSLSRPRPCIWATELGHLGIDTKASKIHSVPYGLWSRAPAQFKLRMPSYPPILRAWVRLASLLFWITVDKGRISKARQRTSKRPAGLFGYAWAMTTTFQSWDIRNFISWQFDIWT